MSHKQSWKLHSLLLLAATVALPAQADVIVCANDNHTTLVDGVMSPAKKISADTLSVIDVAQKPPKIVGTVEVPCSVMGPPMAVAISKGGKFAVVASATKMDGDKIVPDDRVTLLDLSSNPPKILSQANAGTAPTSAAFSSDNSLLLVTNRNEGTLSLFQIQDGNKIVNIGKLELGNAKANPNGVMFIPGTHTALVTRDGDHMVSVVKVDGTKMTIDPRTITAGIRPYGLDITNDGSMAVISNAGRGDGDVDTISLVDLTSTPYKTVDTAVIGYTPEGVRFSPDGAYIAAVCQNGSQKATSHPTYHDHGIAVLLSVKDKKMHKVAEAPVGRWSQGLAFSQDGKTLLVENMWDKNLTVFNVNGGKLKPAEPLSIESGPASISVAW